MLAKITKNMLENWRKCLQNGPKTSPESILEGVWRPLGSHPWSKVLPRPHFWRFWLQFGTPFGTSLGSFWASFVWCFLKRLFDGPGLHLGSQNTSKIRPQREPKPKSENHIFCLYLLHFSHIQGCCISHFFRCFFWNPLLGWFLDSILMI